MRSSSSLLWWWFLPCWQDRVVRHTLTRLGEPMAEDTIEQSSPYEINQEEIMATPFSRDVARFPPQQMQQRQTGTGDKHVRTHDGEQDLPPEHTGPCQDAQDGGLRRSTLVMVIDDSSVVRKILEAVLRRERMEVVSYPDGVEALRAVTTRQLDRLPDLLFLDIELPRMNGFEIAHHLRTASQWDQTAIVMLSRRDGILDRLKARLVGTQAYLTKPFTTQMILEIVQNCVSVGKKRHE